MTAATLCYGITLAVCCIAPTVILMVCDNRTDTRTLREARALITVLEQYVEDNESMKAHLDARVADLDRQVVELSNTARRLREAAFAAKFD